MGEDIENNPDEIKPPSRVSSERPSKVQQKGMDQASDSPKWNNPLDDRVLISTIGECKVFLLHANRLWLGGMDAIVFPYPPFGNPNLAGSMHSKVEPDFTDPTYVIDFIEFDKWVDSYIPDTIKRDLIDSATTEEDSSEMAKGKIVGLRTGAFRSMPPDKILDRTAMVLKRADKEQFKTIVFPLDDEYFEQSYESKSRAMIEGILDTSPYMNIREITLLVYNEDESRDIRQIFSTLE